MTDFAPEQPVVVRNAPGYESLMVGNFVQRYDAVDDRGDLAIVDITPYEGEDPHTAIVPLKHVSPV